MGVFKSQRRDLFFKQLGRMTLGHGLGAVALAAAAVLVTPLGPLVGASPATTADWIAAALVATGALVAVCGRPRA